MKLREAVRAQISYDGEPLNAFGSCTTDSLLIFFGPLVPDLEANAKFVLTTKLNSPRLAPVGESASLFNVNEEKIQAILSSS